MFAVGDVAVQMDRREKVARIGALGMTATAKEKPPRRCTTRGLDDITRACQTDPPKAACFDKTSTPCGAAGGPSRWCETSRWTFEILQFARRFVKSPSAALWRTSGPSL
jgi:hypothetical protein